MLTGSLLILDEAHHAAPASGGHYGIETRFTRAVRDICGRFEHRLFLSATPHNGHSSSFSTLLELLDPYRFTRGVKVRGKKDLEEVMVRRLKEDIREVQGGFPKRRVVREAIDDLPHDAPELVLSRLLDEYRTAREERHQDAYSQGANCCWTPRCRPAAAAALIDRSIRAESQSPPEDGRAPVGEGGWRDINLGCPGPTGRPPRGLPRRRRRAFASGQTNS